ncbi:COP9 signalosome complex subunit 8 [Coccidioides immitis RS]|uniref:COP9 signalosome complex subunit 8 n=3 Tax=Coccidioides immitis TaxID=5501 RepID=J3KKV9_COCIM|nr:COP9 signalosome complex subunit 8 [Coccidioides immitis RS]EAS36851.3 COP9 signalosome complex subunit 8 [Coccidioides immitis RS]KMP09758.1 hypothetical protein CIRG_08991 [Coccidioides immitis RMSCC 2394]KMU90211.1 hypothetical protein CIHG_08021 [Coccidioides immitis H538.4]TPX25089.1 hypothetical protein DIZ76_010538 [Coccidioides immitis]
MSTAPQTLEELSHVLTSAPSAAALLQALMDAEGEISLRFGETHVPSDTEFLRTYYSAYFYALLLRDEINEARMLMQRIPQSLISADVVLQNTLTLLRAVWNKKHATVYQVLRESAWPDMLQPLAETYVAYFRDKTLGELSITYGAIRPETAALYLGFNLSSAENDAMGDIPDSATSELIAALVEKGWEYDSDTKLLKPVPRPVSGGTELDQVKIGKLAALLGNYGG